MLLDALSKVIDRQDLTRSEAEAVMDQIMDGMATPVQIGAYLTAMRMKGETVEEIIGSARAMRRKSIRIETGIDNLIDTCGTGGDGSCSLNISTAAAFVLAAAGLPVAKHGNRSVSSRCGSADVLMELGVDIEMDSEEAAAAIGKVGMAFLFAPVYHPAMRYAAPIRRELKVRSIFNVLGPLTNPAGARRQLMGVFTKDLVVPLASALAGLGVESAMVVSGLSGFDEIATFEPTAVATVENGTVTPWEIDPRDYGVFLEDQSAITGGTVVQNAEAIERIFSGEEGPFADIVALNAGAGLVVGGLAQDIRCGIEMARSVMRSGSVLKKLKEVRLLSAETMEKRRSLP